LKFLSSTVAEIHRATKTSVAETTLCYYTALGKQMMNRLLIIDGMLLMHCCRVARSAETAATWASSCSCQTVCPTHV